MNYKNIYKIYLESLIYTKNTNTVSFILFI